MYLWTIIRGQYLWDIRNDNQWHSDFTVSFTFYSPGISMSTNLILRPDIVHSVSFSWNLITKRHKEHNGSWVMSNQWWLQREKKNSIKSAEWGDFLNAYLFPVCFSLEKKPRLYAQQIPTVIHKSTMTTTSTPSAIPRTSISSVGFNQRSEMKHWPLIIAHSTWCYLHPRHTYRLPSAGLDTERILHRSSLGRNNHRHLLFWLRWTSALENQRNESD